MTKLCAQNINYSIYNGHTFFRHNSAIFWPIRLKFFLGTQETIIYRFAMRNHDLDAFWKKFNFWRENGHGRHAGAKGSWASRPDQKIGSSGGTLRWTVISEKSFRKFRARTPSLNFGKVAANAKNCGKLWDKKKLRKVAENGESCNTTTTTTILCSWSLPFFIS